MSAHGLKRIAVLGEIGSGNLGDDYGYVLLRDELRKAFENLDILVDIRPVTPNLFGLLAGYHWDAVVTGCGTLLDAANGPYVRALVDSANKCSVAILGTGVSDPRHATTTNDGRLALDELLLKTSRHTWLRNLPATLYDETRLRGPDPFWLHGWHADSEGRPVVGINLGYAGFSTLNLDPQFIAIARGVRQVLAEQGQRTALFTAWSADYPWVDRLRTEPAEEINLITGTQETMLRLNACSSMLTTRIHLGVLAACRGAWPVLPDYAGKVRAVFDSAGVPFTALPTKVSVTEYVAALTAKHESPMWQVRGAHDAAVHRVRDAAVAIAGAW